MGFGSFNYWLRDGLNKGYAVAQININNLEFVQAIIEAAEEERAPIILGASEGALKYMGLDYAVAIAKTAAERASVPVMLHLDHGPNLDWVLKAIRNGFSSVMIDASRLPLEENIALTKKVVDLCHPLGIEVEAELGRITGTDDDLTVDERLATLCRPEDAERFVAETHVDALAAAIGSAHGHYKGKPELDFERLAAIREVTGIPLVLHGGSGIPDEDVKKAISLGIAKMNINTDNQEVFTAKVREVLAANPKMYDPRKYLGPGRDEIKAMVKKKLALTGSVNRV
ncbi:class II fructose-1,6-bisphosphate aldolase [Sulfobacillus thermosulfidooxidans]|uniref:Fructose-bisphosphate aldolase, class II n=2 Tax=Sulfobacillus thermosulfidooxidans TaxID=28034 RepID=A0A1W1WJR6_SULTA|nr:class II fructose-1,6-bisphosphate aldolase [Sulfobacillus thermosulfidooxidans]OLZ08496.1 fructose-1,6-bisphosphate aldolase, class II [Sulfobacillus thermosulfidooxidans]OLZ13099.1 fructose-1,6-bisphosphate aldolase, class II [Sulfobacillus thermosulfidooxidans]OLZ21479.1 fructose-1,6-bisphosphate aldolase, class II [Sulfobacillus thermosulfidooxidans]PSR29176.1 MAG: fructose-1,6-bisphosphate aldolase, class II [Sulfobacillus thermosulfidooxidans]SMC06270.1 fructose-bisphosphate aldolase,